jgi:hypothetical protein
VLNRDSYDNAGAALVSSVHVEFYHPQLGCHGNNAAWLPSYHQMVYGDGDGVNFTHFSKDTDVTAHELTHAVTGDTANLIYQEEPGGPQRGHVRHPGRGCGHFPGLRELKIGEYTTPNTPNDALRYMYNPTLDGKSLTTTPTTCERHHVWSLTVRRTAATTSAASTAAAASRTWRSTFHGRHPSPGQDPGGGAEVGINIARKVFYRARRTT